MAQHCSARHGSARRPSPPVTRRVNVGNGLWTSRTTSWAHVAQDPDMRRTHRRGFVEIAAPSARRADLAATRLEPTILGSKPAPHRHRRHRVARPHSVDCMREPRNLRPPMNAACQCSFPVASTMPTCCLAPHDCPVTRLSLVFLSFCCVCVLGTGSASWQEVRSGFARELSVANATLPDEGRQRIRMRSRVPEQGSGTVMTSESGKPCAHDVVLWSMCFAPHARHHGIVNISTCFHRAPGKIELHLQNVDCPSHAWQH